LTQVDNIRLPLFGERGSPFAPAFLFVLGLGLGVLDLHCAFRGSGERARVVASPNQPNFIPQPKPTITPLPVPAVAKQDGLPARSLPDLKPGTIKAASRTPAQDCPTLFSVTFALGKASPHFDDVALRALIGWINSHPDTNLVVDGHSDSLGSPAFNLSLSQQRADQMVRRFVASGLRRERITRRAFGNYIPVVGTREDSAENRRVVLSVAGMKNCPESESP